MSSPLPFRTPSFAEVGDRVWVARHEWFDANLTLVVGGESALLVDTHASAASMAALLPEIERVTDRPLSAVVASHSHHDHVLGASAVLDRWPGVDYLAHERAAAVLVAENEAYAADATRRAEDAAAELTDVERERLRLQAASPIVEPSRTLSAVWAYDLGDRLVEVVHPGRGHTDGDLVVRVGGVEGPGSAVVVTGDLVEESAPPVWGPDSWPLEWPGTLDLVLQLTMPGDVVVPGHGALVDRGFVEDQRDAVGQVAEQVRALAVSGTRFEDVLAAGEWPYPVEVLDHAVRRAWEHLPRGSRQLPMA
ncbi:MBL fold metallo-hydrolase [Nocardioidaceae bacterium]|nr:MBL fold metallo-hydrolase [Nocardioidaceae bacterium]